MTCPCVLFDWIRLILRRVRIMNFIVLKLSTVSCHLLPFRSKSFFLYLVIRRSQQQILQSWKVETNRRRQEVWLWYFISKWLMTDCE
jgi:hypothetical protein